MENKKMTLIKILWIALATLWLSAVWFRAADAHSAHDECVAYWLNRTASWDNVPAVDVINNDAVFCGNVK